MTLQAALAEFLDGHLRAERNASPHTLRNYGVDLRQFAEFAGAEAVIGELTPAGIRDFLALLYQRGCGKTTVARHLSSLRSLLGYCALRGYIKDNPARLLASPRLGRRLPQFPSTEQVNRMLDDPAPEAAFPERDHALLEVLYGCGLRVSEVTALSLGDVDYEEMTLRVIGKGRRQRIVPFGRKARAALQAYLARRQALPRLAAGERALFL
ncbi:MAG: tyrosine-type recombinase/integrase, partial [Terriglobales bacterium]